MSAVRAARALPAVVPCPPERLVELCRLRASVWIEAGADPAAFPGGLWQEPRDAARRHWVAIAAGEVVAGASLGVHERLADVHQPEAYRAYGLPEDVRIATPDRLIVRRDWRGTPLARRLLEAQEDAARAAGAVLAVRQASHMLRPLLERRGWRCHGPALDDARFGGEVFTVMSLDLGPRGQD